MSFLLWGIANFILLRGISRVAGLIRSWPCLKFMGLGLSTCQLPCVGGIRVWRLIIITFGKISLCWSFSLDFKMTTWCHYGFAPACLCALKISDRFTLQLSIFELNLWKKFVVVEDPIFSLIWSLVHWFLRASLQLQNLSPIVPVLCFQVIHLRNCGPLERPLAALAALIAPCAPAACSGSLGPTRYPTREQNLRAIFRLLHEAEIPIC